MARKVRSASGLIIAGLQSMVLALGSASTLAGTISYVPAAGGYWSDSDHWSLGRCPQPDDDVRIVVSGSANKAVDYDWSQATDFNSLKIDGDGSYYGALWHLNHGLLTGNMYVGEAGEAWEWMEGTAFLHVFENLYVGHYDPGPGHFYLNVSTYGVLVDGDTTVGYLGPGDFDHRYGYHQCQHLFVGQNAPGTYKLQGAPSVVPH